MERVESVTSNSTKLIKESRNDKKKNFENNSSVLTNSLFNYDDIRSVSGCHSQCNNMVTSNSDAIRSKPFSLNNVNNKLNWNPYRMLEKNYYDNNLIMNKNSVVITNSNFLPSDNQNQLLSSITFNDKICLALPPKLSWIELNNCPSNDSELNYLLQITKEMNWQLKRRKKQSRKPKERSAVKRNDPSAQLKENDKTEHSNNSRQVITHVNDKSMKSDVKQKKSDTVSSLCSAEFSHKNIVTTLKHSGKKDSKVGENLLKYDKLNVNFDEVQINDNKLKLLVQESWLNIEDDKEEMNSKEIYDKLMDIVKDFEEDNSNKINEFEKKLEKLGIAKIENKVKKNEVHKKNVKSVDSNKTETKEIVSIKNFEKYYDELIIEEGLKNGTMLKEILRINVKNPREAYISCSNDDKDVFISGIRDRNQALDGDEVVVELYPEDKWTILPCSSIQKSGKVVNILKRVHPRTAVGFLKSCDKTKGIIVMPRDNRLPKIKFSNKCNLDEFKALEEHSENCLFLVKIISWENIHFAEGIILQKIGPVDDLTTIRMCILLENNLNVEPLVDADKYLPSELYTLSDDEIKKRTDIRDCCVFTIDPEGAKDLDDALSCIELPNGNFEVGIHIADVSHYLYPNTPLDKDACEKATSIYLVDAVYHMLPTKLCEACSLTPGTDKLAFSIFVEINTEAEIINHKFAKTIMCSCAQFTYEHAQEIISKKNYLSSTESSPKIMNGFQIKHCANAILNLNFLASKIRKRRFLQGALKIDQPKIVFRLDKNSLPISYSLHVSQESNWMIEEFMIMANVLVANHIINKFPNKALLRHHSSPNEKCLSTIISYLEKVGICIDAATAGSIHQSIMRYDSFDEIGIARMAVIINLLIKPMMRACYKCSSSEIEDNGDDFWHYALNTPFYTHFTSPLRRYADVVVHRFLASSLEYCKTPNWSQADIQCIAENCNKKKNSAKRASETSKEFHLKLYLEKCGPIIVRAVVTEVKKRYFDVIELSTRTTNRVYVYKIEKYSKQIYFENNDGMPSLTVIWTNSEKTEKLIQIIQVFTIVDLELSSKNYFNCSLNKITANLLKPI